MAKKHWPIILLLFLALVTRFYWINQPNEVVFDEVHFGKFVSAYFTGEYVFDIHPPLGKMLIAGTAKFFGYNAQTPFEKIGEKASGKILFSLRFLPAFVSILFVLLLYLFTIKLGLSKKTAFLAGFLGCFDNAILAQSKFILLDIFLLFFGILGIYFYLIARNKSANTKYLFLVLSAIFAACAFSIKWTGISFIALILLLAFIDSLKNFYTERSRSINLKKTAIKLGILLAVPFLVYFIIFSIHFGLLYKSGQGDAFMSQSFQKTLFQNNVSQNIAPISNWSKFTELNSAMYRYNSSITKGHPDGSTWHEWLKGKKPIWFWTKYSKGEARNIYLLGNPAIWWAIPFVIVLSLVILFFRRLRKKIPPITYLFVFGYILNLLPYIFISRVAFLYHYLPSLVFGIIVFAILYDKLFENKKQAIVLPVYILFLIIVFSTFIYFAPLTYGKPVSLEKQETYTNYIKSL